MVACMYIVFFFINKRILETRIEKKKRKQKKLNIVKKDWI